MGLDIANTVFQVHGVDERAQHHNQVHAPAFTRRLNYRNPSPVQAHVLATTLTHRNIRWKCQWN